VSKTKTQMTTRITTETQTQLDLETGLSTAGLTAREERALRMRYGMTRDLDAELTFADVGHSQARAQVEEIERRVVTHLQTNTDARKKQAIIEELRKL